MLQTLQGSGSTQAASSTYGAGWDNWCILLGKACEVFHQIESRQSEVLMGSVPRNEGGAVAAFAPSPPIITVGVGH